jgi:hypothetical protein
MIKRFWRRYIRFGVLVHGNKIWLSEFVGILFVAGLLAILFSITLVILFNGRHINTNHQVLSELKTESTLLSYEREELRSKARLHAVMNHLVGNRISKKTLVDVVELVYGNSKTYGYDPFLVLAVIHVESVFDPNALGRFQSGELSGALGLMQLKYETARETAGDLGMVLDGTQELFRPEINIVLGVAYLTRQIALFKSFKLGLLAYNQGPGTIIETLSNKRPLSVAYYNKVLKSYFKFRRMADEML